MIQPALRSFRLVCKPHESELVEALLGAQGFAFEPEPFSPLARRLSFEPFPLGSSLAARFGYLYVQDRSSMLPPLALCPKPGSAVLDMCASPGSKTGFLCQMVGDSGFVLGNEPSKIRLTTLRRNMQQLNMLCCSTTSYPAGHIPLPEPGEPADKAGTPCPGWSFILLDPPCSGWGTVEKHPKAAVLWRGDKIKPLIALQKNLLKKAECLLRPGGLVVYSTCTTNTAENEDQIRRAIDDTWLELLPITPPQGFVFAPSARQELDGMLKVETGPDGQGFFVALLQKTGNPPERPAPDSGSFTVAGGFFERPCLREGRFVGERRRHGKNPHGRGAEPVFLPTQSLDGPLCESSRLPPGDLAVFNDLIHFLPAARHGLIPENFVWKGHVLGRMGRSGEARAFDHLRTMMPDAATAAQNKAAVLDLEDISPLLDLLGGQSLAVESKTGEAGLYFRGLPLCRLAIKSGRAVLKAGAF